MSQYPITQAQWRVIAGMRSIQRELTADPSQFKGDNRPVEQVSWEDAVEFCQRLEQVTHRPYRLPTEAEWEYACRAGTTTPFHVGATITTDLANYNGQDWETLAGYSGSGAYGDGPCGEFRGETTDVGSFPPNAFGLYDMHGNVSEWCQDHWHKCYDGAPEDGSAWIDSDESKRFRVLRNGAWNSSPSGCRSASRSWEWPNSSIGGYGFRVVCAPLGN